MPESDFCTALAHVNCKILGFGLIDFKLVHFEELPDYDWIFFYSKAGIDYFFQNINEKKILLPPATQWAAFGEGTAKALQAYGFEADFIGTGSAVSTANAFSNSVINKKVLFPQAQFSRNSVELLLKKSIVIPLIVYKNTAKQDFSLPFCDILVFTSPLNVKAYFTKYTLHPTQQFVAIGDTTLDTLRAYIPLQNVTVSKSAAEKSLADTVIDLITKASQTNTSPNHS
jgi:hydroxymethylbilane synthase